MIVAAIIFFTLLLFKNSFFTYFFQDDWFLLAISKIKAVGDFLHFFIPRFDVQFYRPLSHEIFYFIGQHLFGLNPLGFHAVAWIFFIANIILVWKLSKIFLADKKLSLLFAFLYATSAIHYNSLFWIINFSYILVGFWYFAGFLIFVKSGNSGRTNFLLNVIFILGLLSNEFMITFPAILFIYILLFKSRHLRKYFPLLTGLVVIVLFYLFVRLFIFKPSYGTYQFVFNKSVISSYRFFVLFFLNWPETMKDQMITFYRVNGRFLQTFSSEFYIFLTNLALFAIVFILLPVISFIANAKYKLFIFKKYKELFFALLWFLINLLPIIFIPSHISPHQGTIAFWGFLLLFFVMFDGALRYLNKYLSVILIISIIISWVVSSYTAIILNDKIHWIKRRSDLAYQWVKRTKTAFPTLPQKSTIQIPADDTETRVALFDGWGIREIYNDESLNVILSTESSKFKEVKVVP